MTRVVALLGVLLLLGCSSPEIEPTREVVFDLVEQFDSAEVRVETTAIDLGTAKARDYLGSGWSWNETSPDGTSFVWSLSRPSQILFFINESRPSRLSFRCRPLRHQERSVDGLSVQINGRRVDEVLLSRGWQEMGVSIPADAVVPGLNTLTFDAQWRPEPPPLDNAGGNRQVAVAFDWIRFRRPDAAVSEAKEPEANNTGSTLTLTAGSRVDYFVVARPGSALILDSARTAQGRPAQLEITAHHDRGTTRVLLSSEGDAGELRAPLPDTPGPLRVRFETHGDSFVLTRPRIVAPPAGSEPLPSEAIRSAPPQERPQPSLVLLYLIDALRADHLSGLDYSRDTSPGLATFMKKAVVFEHTVAQSSWTKASVGSILTGRYPWTHGGERLRDALIEDLDLLPQLLQRAGFRTGAFVANGFVGEPFGFNRGWDRFQMMPETQAASEQIHRSALDWLDSLPGPGPTFLYIHTVEPHTPYDPAERFLSRFAPDGVARRLDRQIGTVDAMRQLAGEKTPPDPSLLSDLIDLYDGEIATADFELSRLIDELNERELFHESLFVVVSDHGEELYDHGGWTHGRTLHRESLDVPLIIRFPGGWAGGTRVATRTQHIDLLPSLLDYLEIDPPTELPGKSLLCAIERAASKADLECPGVAARPIFSGIHYYENHWVSVISGDWKLIVGRIDALDTEARLYQIAKDPAETANLAQTYPVLVGYLTSLIRRELRRNSHRKGSVEVQLDEATEKRLEALGYLE